MDARFGMPLSHTERIARYKARQRANTKRKKMLQKITMKTNKQRATLGTNQQQILMETETIGSNQEQTLMETEITQHHATMETNHQPTITKANQQDLNLEGRPLFIQNLLRQAERMRVKSLNKDKTLKQTKRNDQEKKVEPTTVHNASNNNEKQTSIRSGTLQPNARIKKNTRNALKEDAICAMSWKKKCLLCNELLHAPNDPDIALIKYYNFPKAVIDGFPIISLDDLRLVRMNQCIPKLQDVYVMLRNIFVVVDTNVFISNLLLIKKISKITYYDSSRPIIYVPWMVMEELHYFKDGYMIQRNNDPKQFFLQETARKVIMFINNCLIARNRNIIVESTTNFSQHSCLGKTPDDSILRSCIALQKHNKTILMTQDMKLRKLSRSNDVDAFCSQDTWKLLITHKMHFRIIQLVWQSLTTILAIIIPEEAKKNGVELYTNSWTYQTYIVYMKNTYDMQLKNVLQKQCRKVIDDLFVIFESGEIENEKTFQELSVSLLQYLKNGLPQYAGLIQNALNEAKLDMF